MTEQEQKLRRFLRDLYNCWVVEPGDMDTLVEKIPELLGVEPNEFGSLPSRFRT
jgi:hypothetical protein